MSDRTPAMDARVGCIKGELVLLASEKYVYTLRPHPDSTDPTIRTWGSKAELVRRLAPNGASWLVLRNSPYLGLPEAEWLDLMRDDPGALRFTGELVVLEVYFGYVVREVCINW